MSQFFENPNDIDLLKFFEKIDLFIYLIEQNVYIFIYTPGHIQFFDFYIPSLLSINKVYINIL